MAYDVARGQLVVFGGSSWTSPFMYLADTWEWGVHPRATASKFGVPCGTFPGVHLNAAAGSLPALGEKLRLEIRGLPTSTSAGVLVLGSSRTAFGAIKLPLDLSRYGMKGCHLYTSFDFPLAFPITRGLGSHVLAMPFQAAFTAKKFYAQAFGTDRIATRLGVVSSNGLELTLGYR